MHPLSSKRTSAGLSPYTHVKKRHAGRALLVAGFCGCLALVPAKVAAPWSHAAVWAAPAPAWSVAELQAMAMEQSPAVAGAVTRWELAVAERRKVAGGFLPQVSVSGGVGHTQGDDLAQSPGGGQGGATGAQPLRLSIQEEIPIGAWFGKEKPAVIQADYAVRAAERDLARARQQAALDALTAAINLLKGESGLQLAEESLRKTEAMVEDTRLRQRLGSASQLDVLRAENQLDTAAAAAQRARHNLELARWRLNQVLGRPIHEPIAVRDDFAFSALSLSYEEAIATALQARPEIITARENVQRELELDQATLDSRTPTLTLSGTVRRDRQAATASVSNTDWSLKLGLSQVLAGAGSTGKPGSPSSETSWAVGLNASWLLYDGGMGAQSRKQTALRMEQLEQTLAQTETSIRIEVRDALFALQEAEGKVTTARRALEVAEAGLAATQARVTAGADSSRALLEAQLTLAQAQTDLQHAIYDHALSRARLRHALGQPVSD